ncbi:dTDP-4-amino-4,6-dideoxygalactose transaminase [Hymenobacter sp. GOD-10R]|uniref:dTDP-4-amino-4,6-dideoxygalactose transaminase n=1 Tax=Hymenobacter sp. GOD-10R TaxID=3093922 RepID=UPI002D77ECC6|nr:dTDP-4-amino-4,6-dideoxygalactose transaminase [Hymenobacter sp. GOD-10R]WRQ27444.1 dTDP-4-amino-4,6-dideoxygalactose transaminase [Hymenobacter sp. GOD-10R]
MSLAPIPFNKPYLSGQELAYIQQALRNGKLSGNGWFTQQCQQFLEQRYGIRKALLTTSGTAALEMAALLLDIQPGDEVIVPTFTFTSTANAFVLRGAHIVFADSLPEHPNVDVAQLEPLITSRTRAIVVVHYAGVACDMAAVMALAARHNLFVIEDAAQAIDGYYQQRPLGSIGHLAAFSFHETKNVIAGEGGLLSINDARFQERAEIIWEKGTNRAAYFRGETARYQWVDVGSSYLASELNAAYLWAQLEKLGTIQAQRQRQWEQYYQALAPLAAANFFALPVVPAYALHNWHIFYLLCHTLEERTALIQHLSARNILAVFHYQTLHNSPFYMARHDGRTLPNAGYYADHLVRLPLFFELTFTDQQRVVKAIQEFYASAASNS